MKARQLLASGLLALACAFQACGPEDSQGPGNDITPGGDPTGGTGKDTLTAGTNAGAGDGSGKVPGIDCEGICGNIVTKPPAGSGVSDTSRGGTTPQTWVDAGTVVVQQCFRGAIPGNDTAPLVKVKHSLTQTADGEVITALVVFSRDFTDNTYGANAIGWNGPNGHTFDMLSGSDHAELSLLDGAGNTVIQAKIDLISKLGPSDDFASLGVDGGDGALLKGNRSDIVSTGTSMDDNFIRYGYKLLKDSPKTDSNYTPNPDYPYWNFYNVYRITVKRSAFGSAGFGKAMLSHVHASPSKFPQETIQLKEGSCPVVGERNPFPGSSSTGTGGSGTGTGTGGTGTGTGTGGGGAGDNT